MTMASGAPIYTVKRLSKSYGGVKALDAVDFEIISGEVHALLGANGAGKSTLIKILAGGDSPDKGSLELEGLPVRFGNSREAALQGVAIVSQELTLFPSLDVLQNLFLGREPLIAGISLDRRAMRREAQPVLERIGLDVDLDRPLEALRLGEQQLVEVARALLNNPRILILDEPTSALRPAETERLHTVVRSLRDRGAAIVYVSHFLKDVFSVADRVTVLRGGRIVVSRHSTADISIEQTVVSMLGKRGAGESRRVRSSRAETVSDPEASLVLEGVAVDGLLDPLDLTARPGEVVGLAGLEGSGAHCILDIAFGRLKPSQGELSLPGGARRPTSTNRAVVSGVSYVPADRKRLGLMLDSSIAENVCMVRGGPLKRMGFFLRRNASRTRALHWRDRLKIAMASPNDAVSSLSGGNQQKVVFAKWLEAAPALVLLDDPCRGVDIGAKEDMHAIISDMAMAGKVILYTSTDLAEMAIVCDRVVVFIAAAAVGELEGDKLSEHLLLDAINFGIANHDRPPGETL